MYFINLIFDHTFSDFSFFLFTSLLTFTDMQQQRHIQMKKQKKFKNILTEQERKVLQGRNARRKYTLK